HEQQHAELDRVVREPAEAAAVETKRTRRERRRMVHHELREQLEHEVQLRLEPIELRTLGGLGLSLVVLLDERQRAEHDLVACVDASEYRRGRHTLDRGPCKAELVVAEDLTAEHLDLAGRRRIARRSEERRVGKE